MADVTIQLRNMDVAGCAEFLGELRSCPDVSRYCIDLSGLRYVSPFGMLVCSLALRRFRTSRPDCDFDVISGEGQDYAGHMGFFQAFGVEVGKAPGEAAGSDRYLPVTLLDLEQLRDEARQNLTAVQNVIEARASELATMLVRGEDPDLTDTLGYAMTEMFRNVLEHSGALQVGYCAQYWPSKDMVEVGILDSGKGIRAALSANPHLRIEDDLHALHLALLPGVSGTAYEGVRRDPYDHWANSGFGLYMTSSLCSAGGDFLICSGDAAIKLKGGEEECIGLFLEGTALRLRIKPSLVGTLSKTLGKLAQAGEAMEKEMTGTVPIASGASKLGRLTVSRHRGNDK